MNEHVCQFGPGRALTGIVSLPPGQDRPSGPVVVFLSAGLLHRVGPFRLYIAMARDLAAAGISSLRFDLSGIGDSGPSALAASIEARTLADVRAAFDYLGAQHGSDQFVVGGLCSGADDAFRTALADERVVGSFQLDGMGYRTPKFYRGLALKHYLPRLASAEKWKQIASRLAGGRALHGADEYGAHDEDLHRSMPSLDEAREGLRAMEARGQRTLLVYSGGGASSYYNYAGQLFDSIPEARQYTGVDEVYLPEADHSYLLACDRRRVQATLRAWYQRCWPAASTAPSLSAVG